MNDDITKYAIGALVALLIFSIAAAWGAFSPSSVPGASVHILNMEAPASVCPGMKDIVNITFDVLEPSVLDVHVVYESIEDPAFTHDPVKGLARNIFGKEEIVSKELHWIVPELEPGIYNRVVSITSHDAGRAPAFAMSQVLSHSNGDCPLK